MKHVHYYRYSVRCTHNLSSILVNENELTVVNYSNSSSIIYKTPILISLILYLSCCAYSTVKVEHDPISVLFLFQGQPHGEHRSSHFKWSRNNVIGRLYINRALLLKSSSELACNNYHPSTRWKWSTTNKNIQEIPQIFISIIIKASISQLH